MRFVMVPLLCAAFVRRRRIVRTLGPAMLAVALNVSSPAQEHAIESASTGLLEVGTPLFAVRSPESIGLSSRPTDLHVMPDGRILVFAQQQLALGDGIRWEVLRQAASDTAVPARGVAISPEGELFAATADGFARIEFGTQADWRTVVIEPWSASDRNGGAVPRVAVVSGDEWLWHSGSGAVVAWRPGNRPRAIGRADSIQHVFQLGAAHYLSDRTSGALWQLGAKEMQPVAPDNALSVSETITCAASYDDETVLVGTYGRGLRRFNGQSSQPFVSSGLLASAVRINDLCATEGGFYAAAVEDHGIVFFDRSGRTVQVLDRRADHRLAHIQRLVAAPGGMILGLTSEGIVQVEFPSRVSHFEPLIGSGMNVAHPFRFNGQLWIWADGSLRRAVYDEHGRMTELRVDSPPGRFASNPSTAIGRLITATDDGAYFRTESGWTAFAPGVDNLRVLDHPPADGRWLYAATGEMGWLRPTASGIELQSIAEPRLEKVFDSVQAGDGTVWLELGNGRLGQLRLVAGEPRITFFNAEHGIPDSWAQVFRIDDRVAFNIGDQILRFDESTRRFVRDQEFTRRVHGLTDIVGRPGRDSLGRLWITANGRVHVLEERNGGWRNLHERMPPGLLPYYFTFEDNGVVWLHSDGRLARYDPAVPEHSDPPLRAVITRVIAGSGQRSFYPHHQQELLPALPFAENSLVVHFCAPGSALRALTFDVMLEGENPEWVPSGSSGAAAFSHLREGEYRLRVRPRSGSASGVEASLAFQIRPPWYRAPYAYAGYMLGALVLVWLSGRALLYFQRREHARLEQLVVQRTGELHASNERLATQLAENQILLKAIEQSPTAIFITDPAGHIVFANPRAYEMNAGPDVRLIGSPIRALRAPSVTAELFEQIAATVRRGETWNGQLANRHGDRRTVPVRSMIAPIRSADGEVRHHLILEEDITEALSEQERRQRLEAQLIQAQKFESIGTLAGGIAHDFNNVLTAILGYCELASLDSREPAAVQADLAGIRSAGLRAKDLISRILTFSRQTHVQLVPLDLTEPVAEAIKLLRASTPATIEIVSTLQSGTIRADATQIQQVVLNLCTNAAQALPNQHGRIEVTVQRVHVSAEIALEVPQLWVGEAMRLVVTDDGCGMDETTLRRIFDPFFTTKPQGEGTGLGLAIVQGVVAGHEGAIHVRSSRAAGTSVEVYFRLSNEVSPPPTPDAPVPRGNQQEVIVVDDERTVANFAALRLQQLGYRPMVFCDPQAALNAFAAQPARFQAIVTDLTMPHLTGADLIKQIRARGWLIPAVIITGYQGDAIRANVRALPRCLVLGKPFSGDDLARALHQVISDYSIRRSG